LIVKQTAYCLFLLLLILCSCKEHKQKEKEVEVIKCRELETSMLSSLLTENKLDGVVLIYDEQKKVYHSNNFEESKVKLLPASTFKIPNSIIGLESGILKDAKSVFKWDGKSRSFPMWEKDLTLQEAFQVSCVPCYQELAIKIGVDTMTSYLARLQYPGMIVNQESLDMFWLKGNSKISPQEQIEFLKRLHKSDLDVSQHATKTMIDIMVIDKNADYSLSGKTGWGIIDDKNIGWFVGYLEVDGKPYFFATAITPHSDFDMKKFVTMRKEITLKAFGALGII